MTKKKPIFFLLILTIILVLPAIVMLLWNAILPKIIGVSVINYWQALGIFILSKILFGGIKLGKRSTMNNHKCESFMKMDQKEKSIFKEEWKKRIE